MQKMSYGFGMIRWRNVILAVEPKLKGLLDVYEGFIRSAIEWSLKRFDRDKFYRHPHSAAHCLIVMYEGISSMKPSSIVDSSAKGQLLLELEVRLFNLFYKLFRSGSTKTRPLNALGDMASIYNAQLKVSGLLPPECRGCTPRRFDDIVLKVHRLSSGSEWRSMEE